MSVFRRSKGPKPEGVRTGRQKEATAPAGVVLVRQHNPFDQEAYDPFAPCDERFMVRQLYRYWRKSKPDLSAELCWAAARNKAIPKDRKYGTLARALLHEFDELEASCRAIAADYIARGVRG